VNWIRNLTWLSHTTCPNRGQNQSQTRQGMAQQTISPLQTIPQKYKVLQSSAVSTGNRNVLVIHNATYPHTQRTKQPVNIGIRIDNGALISPDLEDPPIYGTQFSSKVDFCLPQHRSQLMCIILRQNKALLAVTFSKDTSYRYLTPQQKEQIKERAPSTK